MTSAHSLISEYFVPMTKCSPALPVAGLLDVVPGELHEGAEVSAGCVIRQRESKQRTSPNDLQMQGVPMLQP